MPMILIGGIGLRVFPGNLCCTHGAKRYSGIHVSCTMDIIEIKEAQNLFCLLPSIMCQERLRTQSIKQFKSSSTS